MRTALVLLCCALAVVLAAPQRPGAQPPGENIAIVTLNSEVNPDGTFSFNYEGANGIKAEETGKPGNGPPGEEGTNSQGSFSFVGDDGNTYSITYTADENGFLAQGAHIPTPPPIPEAIQRSIEFNAKNPEPEEGAAPARRGR